MKKWITLFLCIAMLLAMTAGCAQPPADTEAETSAATGTESSAAQESSEAPAPELTITYQSISATDMFSKCFAEYQKTHPNLTLDPIARDADGYAEAVMAQVQTNTVPDVTWNNAAQHVANTNAYPDVYLDMTDATNTRFADRFVGGTFAQATTADGRITCLPTEMQIQGWLVNTALFAQYNLEIPQTFDDLIAAAAVFRANGLTLFGDGTLDVWPTWGYYHWMQLWGIDDEGDALFTDGTMKFSESDAATALYKICELYAAGAYPDDNATIGYEQTKQLFLSGQCAMITTSTDQLTGIVGSDLDLAGDIAFVLDISFTDSPYDQNQAIKMVGNGYGLSASMPQEKVDALLDFFDWMYSDAGANIVIADGIALPISANITADVSPLTQSIVDRTGDEKRGTITATYAYYGRWGLNLDITLPAYYSLDGTLNACINGSVTAADLPGALQDFDELVATAIVDYHNLPAN